MTQIHNCALHVKVISPLKKVSDWSCKEDPKTRCGSKREGNMTGFLSLCAGFGAAIVHHAGDRRSTGSRDSDSVDHNRETRDDDSLVRKATPVQFR